MLQIQVGRMQISRGHLQKIRSSTVVISAFPSATAEELLHLAVEKHLACDRSLPRINYRLIYPDGTEVRSIPGTEDCFSLAKYKHFIGKAYQRLMLYICSEDDYLEGTKQHLS